VDTLNPALIIGLLIAVLIGAWIDVRRRRIPNTLTAAAAVSALVVRGAMGFDPLLMGFVGAGLALLVMLPLFAMGGVGGGDAKLMIAVGAFTGPGGFVVAALATAIAGGIIAIAYSVRRGVVIPMLLNLGAMFKFAVSFGKAGGLSSYQDPGAVTVPYGVAIAAGSLIAIWYGV
jgi:prepilin peptidase CpaA